MLTNVKRLLSPFLSDVLQHQKEWFRFDYLHFPQNPSGELSGLPFQLRHAQDTQGIVGRFHHGKMAGQKEVFVEVHSPDDLLRHNIPAAVAGDDQREDFLAGKIVGAEQRGQPVDKSCDIGAERVVVIRADHDQAVAV